MYPFLEERIQRYRGLPLARYVPLGCIALLTSVLGWRGASLGAAAGKTHGHPAFLGVIHDHQKFSALRRGI